jgi:hypothetical protein
MYQVIEFFKNASIGQFVTGIIVAAYIISLIISIVKNK